MSEPYLGKQLWAVFFLIFIAFPIASVLASFHIAQFIFVTEPQTLSPGQISQELTVQTRDAAGSPVEAGETMDIEFTSSSPSGEFLNSSGNPVSTVMNKNWKSRTFYYRDSAPGDHEINLKATGRESGKSWEATQRIRVSLGQSAPPPPPEPSPSSSPEAVSTPVASPAPPPAEVSPAAQPTPQVETSLPPAGVREEEPISPVATATPSAISPITPVQVPVPRPMPEAPKLARAPETRRKPESLPVASAAASPASSVIASAPRASSNPLFFFLLASGLSSTAAIGFLAIKKFFTPANG